MSLGIKSMFPVSRGININYDWIDVVNSAGYIIFDGFNAIDSSGSNYVLAVSDTAAKVVALRPYDSTTAGVSVEATFFAGGGGSKALDLDFDSTTFQNNQTIEGDAYVRLTMTGNQTAQCDSVYAIVKFRTWDGSTETDIANVQTQTNSLIANETQCYSMVMAIPKLTVKKGEIIRLTVELYSSDSDHFQIAHNPRDTACGSTALGGQTPASAPDGSSRLFIALPFKIDI